MSSPETRETVRVWIWNLFWAWFLFTAINLTIGIWKEALKPVVVGTEPTTYSEEGEKRWNIDGKIVTAHHITSTDPTYFAAAGLMAITGYDKSGQVIWMLNGVKSFKREGR